MRKQWCGWMALAALAVAGCENSDIAQAADSLPKLYKEAEALGMPLHAKDLEHPSVPDDRNAALLLAKPLEQSSTERKAVEELVKDRKYKELEAALAKLPEMARAEKLAGMDYAPKRDYDFGAAVMFPELAILKDGAKLCAYRAVARAHRGDIDGTLEDLARITRFGEFANTEPTLIGHLVGVAIEAIRSMHIRLAAEELASKPTALAALKGAVERGIASDPLHYMKGEVFMGVNMYRNYSLSEMIRVFGPSEDYAPGEKEAETREPDPKELVRDGLPKDRGSQAGLARYLEIYIPVWKDLQAANGDQAKQALIIASLDNINFSNQPSQAANKILLPVFAQAGVASIRARAVREMTGLMVGALETKARTGKFPAKLDLNARDPFSNQPYGYRLEGDGFRIWSVGTDKEDNGGLSRQESMRKRPPAEDAPPEKYDEVVLYPSSRQ